MSSAIRFDPPITLVGRTALSVEIRTNRSVPTTAAASTTFAVPRTLVRNASCGWSSRIGTCLWAAAWNTTWGRCSRNTSSIRSRSRMSARTDVVRTVERHQQVVQMGLVVVQEREAARARSCVTCRAISEPMDPPAPVMSTRLPRRS